jgi:hypothetical protein
VTAQDANGSLLFFEAGKINRGFDVTQDDTWWRGLEAFIPSLVLEQKTSQLAVFAPTYPLFFASDI